MSDVRRRLENLSPEKRELLLRKLQAEAKAAESRDTIPVRDLTRAAPLSFAQQRLWFIDRLQPGLALYNLPIVLRVEGQLDVTALDRSLQLLLSRHDVLRTTFADEAMGPVQRVAPTQRLSLASVDLQALPMAEREEEARKLAYEEVRRPFDLLQGPLLRATLLKLGEQDHLLVMVLHHIVFDIWSMGVLVREVLEAYGVFSRGGQPTLPPLRTQYADWAAWQRSDAQREALEAQRSWWKERLAGLEMLELPTDRARRPGGVARSAVHSFRFPPERWAAVKALAQREGATPFMVLLSVLDVLLFRYSGQADVAVGTPVAGRNRREVEGLIGFFVNTLVMRTNLSGEPSFREVLSRVRETCVGAYEHQDVPLEHIVAALQPGRDPGQTPFYRVSFNFQNAPMSQVRVPGLTLRPLHLESGLAKLDLSLHFTEGPEGLSCLWEYSADLFEAATVERMAGGYGRLLEALVAKPDTRVGEVELLGEGERRRVLEAWSGAGTEVPRGVCGHALFEAQAEARPEAVAVEEASGRRVSYAELEAKANQLAHHLKKLGVGPERRVGVCLERTVELVVSMLAVLKAGGAYVPIDPSLPGQRVAWMVEEAGIGLVLTQQALADELPWGNQVLVCLEEGWEQTLPQPETRPEWRGGAESLAYVIFTSGSTGRPKGVMVRHGGLANTAAAVAQGHGVKPESRVLQFASQSFDASVAEVFSTLAAGACLCLAAKEALLPGGPLEETVERLGVTVVTLTPSVLRQVKAGALESVRTLISAGEACPPEVVRRWKEGRRFINAYGPTEVTVCATLTQGPVEAERVSIGEPLAGARVYVLDGGLRPVPVGVAGELYVGGAGVARGYLGRADLTAERFLPDEFSGEPGARLYRTGDVVRWQEGGRLEYVGRRDGQWKVRGMRLEVGEVEAVLAECPGVREAAVGVKEVGGDKRLVAYVAGEVEADGVREWMRGQLPEYMVPATYVILDTLPLTTSGKVDRAKLPEPEQAGRGKAYVPPRTPMEQIVADLWAGLLQVERVGATDNFFDLGGHSLIATQVASRIHALVQVDIPLQEIFDAPTVEQLARRLEEVRSKAGGARPVPPLLPASRNGSEPPLSFAQQRLWFLDRLEPGSPLYNIPAAVRLEGRLDVQVLEKCFAEIIRRHEVLRTTFSLREREPVQELHAGWPLRMQVRDLQALSASERDAEVLRLVSEEARAPFDLARGPLLRAQLLRLGAREHVLVLVLHHIVSDAWSTGILLRELGALYPAFSEGHPSPLPEVSVQYADYATWQRSWLSGETLESELEWWKVQLAGAPQVLELPIDRPRPAVQSHRGAHFVQRLPRALQEEVRQLGRREGLTSFMVLLAAFDALLFRYVGQEDIVVGTDVAGRNRREVEGLIGFFINQLVLRTRVEPGLSFRELLKRVRTTTLEAYAHQEVPFEKLVEAVNPERSLGHSPIFQVKLLLQNAPVPELRLPELTLSTVGFETGTAKLDLILSFTEGPEGLSCLWEYSADLFEAATVERMAGGYGRLLEALVAKPDTRVGEVELLGEGERHRVLEAWSGAGTKVPRGVCGHALFEAQAEARPEAVAVEEASGRRVSYAELEAKANQLAHHLKKLGVGPEMRVGVCLERTVELVVSMLAVLKAGGAYVPIDPSLPGQRVAWMVEEAGIGLVLTQQALADELPWGNQVLVCLEEGWEQTLPQPETRPEWRGGAESLAYVIFTSGSTGRPKGVMVRHGGLANTAAAVAQGHGVKPESRVLQFASQSFDASVAEVFSTLAAGACLCLAAKEALLPGGPLEETVERLGVTVVTLTPSVLRQVKAGALESVRTLISAGEACPPEVVRRWKEGRRFINAYGPTEVTVCATLTQGPVEAERVSIGEPLAGARVYVLDGGLRPVPVGVAGELYVGGAGVARGYLGRADLTAERFLPDEFSGEPGARLYRTGDVVRWQEGGRLEYVGRRDGQWKVRGMRLEVGEVEAVLAECPGVREAAVGVKEVGGDKRLVAYVAGEVEADGVREWMRGQLPEYMVPATYVILDTLPLTTSGKVDRAKLPEPEQAGRGKAYVPPRTPMEQIVADLWAGLLQVERVGATDNFFDLGGHSLIATQFMSRIGALFGRELALAAIFECPTVAALASKLSESGQTQAASLPPVLHTPPVEQLPLSFCQEVYWSPEQGGADNPLNSSPVALRLDGALDVEALRRGIEEIVRRHESLRTCFPLVDGIPVQRILPPAPLTLDAVDLGASEAGQEAELRRLLRTEMDRPFDLSRGPLVRCLLYRLSPVAHVLLVNMHHAVTDFVSFSVFASELAMLYAAFREGHPSPLPELPLQYQDFTRWQHAWLKEGALERLREYWARTLAGATEDVNLPTDFPRPRHESCRGESLERALPPELAASLRAVCRQEGVTLFMLLLAAFQVLLARQSGQQDVRVGFAHAQRLRPELDRLIGMFAGYLVIRTDLRGCGTFREVLGRVRTQYLEAFTHQGLPHTELVRLLPGLCRIGFTFSDQEARPTGVPGLDVRPLMQTRGWTLYDLKLGVSDGPAGLVATLEYKTELFRPESISALLGGWVRLLEDIIPRVELPLVDSPKSLLPDV
ncbi:amino acid adenylation domain-containing protein [Stigmatella aurantiaca]|uniref:Amino acid adenylation domain-containing protein n=1 Tax=Stigmatella aurantiaca TaxID=41 RepID=A0A1H8EIN3_STIAU|nr:non-ribosomal peptide synthetase [Stigmatella aurantiaca]SEN18984.1 amino acid adenylation domain-containing protein [Stigmatella aurantiaca]